LKRLEDDYKKAAEAAMMERRDIETRLRSSVKLERSFKPGKVVFKNGEVNRFIENLPVRRESDWIQDLIENQDISEDLPKHHRINSSVRNRQRPGPSSDTELCLQQKSRDQHTVIWTPPTSRIPAFWRRDSMICVLSRSSSRAPNKSSSR